MPWIPWNLCIFLYLVRNKKIYCSTKKVLWPIQPVFQQFIVIQLEVVLEMLPKLCLLPLLYDWFAEASDLLNVNNSG